MEMNTVQLYINTSEEKFTEQGHLRNMLLKLINNS